MSVIKPVTDQYFKGLIFWKLDNLMVGVSVRVIVCSMPYLSSSFHLIFPFSFPIFHSHCILIFYTIGHPSHLLCLLHSFTFTAYLVYLFCLVRYQTAINVLPIYSLTDHSGNEGKEGKESAVEVKEYIKFLEYWTVTSKATLECWWFLISWNPSVNQCCLVLRRLQTKARLCMCKPLC